MKYSQTLIDDAYESNNIASQEKLRSISVLITLGIPIYQVLNKLWTSIFTDTIKFKEYNRNNRWWHGNIIRIMGKNIEEIIGKSESIIGLGLTNA